MFPLQIGEGMLNQSPTDSWHLLVWVFFFFSWLLQELLFFFYIYIPLWFPVSFPVWQCNESFYRSVWPFPPSERSGVVWRVNWPLCQGQSAGIYRLVHCGTYLDMEKKYRRQERLSKTLQPRGSRGRWGHSCLISRLNRGQQLRE